MRPAEKAVLAGLQLRGRHRWDVEDSLRELSQLAESASAQVVYSSISQRDHPDPAFFIGSGKVLEIKEVCRVQKANLVIFDDELTPAQSRNLQNAMGLKVLDRTELIMDIFSQRARTREGQLQIETAQLNYLLPRLAGAWTHLSRQEGGIGTRGPGEKQLEIDRRRVREKITRLKMDLDRVREHRAVQRKRRHRTEVPVAAIIGYTNAGKSTLMNAMTHAGVFVQDKLFATLDPTTRKVTLPNKRQFFLTDTVGFIHKLPHTLVDAFKATLEEVADADVLLHVIDASNPNIEAHVEAVHEVLKEIGAQELPLLSVLNKIDLVEGGQPPRIPRVLEHAVPISAKNGTGFPDLMKALEEMFNAFLTPVYLAIPQSMPKVVAQALSHGHVLDMKYRSNKVYVRIELPRTMIHEFERFVVQEKSSNKMEP